MKHYAEFYHWRDDKWVEAIADRSVLRLDGRMKFQNMCHIAVDWAKRHKFDGYRIGRGERLSELFYLTSQVYRVNRDEM